MMRVSDDVSGDYHTKTWLIWCAGALLPTLLTKNPLYITIQLSIFLLIHRVFARQEKSVLGLSTVVKIAVPILLLASAFNALTVHYGETVLLSLPGGLPLVGGKVTLEALAFGATTGLSLVALLVLFVVFNAVVDYSALLRLVPGFLFHTGTVASIALAFVPQTLRSFREIREAQMIRGHRVRGLRDFAPLFLPFMTSGLEKSLQVAEAMEVRSFGRLRSGTGNNGMGSAFRRIGTLVALLALVFAIYAYYFSSALRLVAMVLGGASVVGLVILFYRASGQVERSRYRQEPWRERDSVVVLLTLTSMFVVGFYHLTTSALLYHPYPRVTIPGFEPALGVALVLLGGPAALTVLSRAGRVRSVVESSVDRPTASDRSASWG